MRLARAAATTCLLALTAAFAPAFAQAPPRVADGIAESQAAGTAQGAESTEDRIREGDDDGRNRRSHRRGGDRLFGPPPADVPAWSALTPEQQHRLARLQPDWESLPPERRIAALQRLRRIDRWNELDAGERERLRDGARNFRELPPELRERMRESFSAINALPEPERRRMFDRWRELTPDQRREWLEAGGPGIAPEPAPGR